MNVLLISSDNNASSGAFLCLIELAKELQYTYHIKVIVVLPKNGDGEILLNKYKIKYRYVYSFSWITYNYLNLKSIAKFIFKSIALIYNFYAIYKLEKIIYEEDIDIVHINTIFSYVGAIAALRTNRKLIWHIRESLNEGFKSRIIFEKIGYKLINQADQILVVSKMIYKEYNDKLCQNKVKIVYDGVNELFYQKREILKDKLVKIACIGGLIPDKNQSEFIKGIHILSRQGYKNIIGYIIGRGEMKNKLKKVVESLNLEKQIKFLGYHKDIKKVLAQCDSTCSVAISEAFGRTLIEGMLSGCVVIAADFDTSAARELINDKKTGFLYTGGDAQDLANTIENMIQDRNNSRKIAQNAQDFAINHFTSKICVRNIVQIYREQFDDYKK